MILIIEEEEKEGKLLFFYMLYLFHHFSINNFYFCLKNAYRSATSTYKSGNARR